MIVMTTMMMFSSLKVRSVCSMGDDACDDDDGDADGDDEDDDADHLEGDISVRHGRFCL